MAVITKINFKPEYLNPSQMIEGRVYAVTNKSLDSLKLKVNSTWIERNYESEFNWENYFTDVYPFVNSYNYVYDISQQIENEFLSN